MIASLRGTITLIRHYIIVEVNGLGYQVFTTATVLQQVKPGDEVTAYTHHHVREDADDLYGFLRLEDVELFEKLIGVSGIGPKAGLALLSQFTAEELQQSIMLGDTTLLTKVSGIGKKTAERLILELKGTLADTITADSAASSPALADALSALEQLGYKTNEALEILQQGDTTAPAEQQIRAALTILGSHAR